jgi:putative spermidine/putrescine transport system permease protein
MSGASPARRTLGGLTARLAALVVAAFVILGPLLSLLLWSLAERWTYPAAWPQRLGFRYWSRMLTGDFLDPLKMSLLIATIVTVAALACAVPLGYALARLSFPGRTLVLLAFLLPQAFPQLPVFAAATREFYRWGLAGTVTGVVLVHLVGGLVFAVWTMTAVSAPWGHRWRRRNLPPPPGPSSPSPSLSPCPASWRVRSSSFSTR